MCVYRICLYFFFFFSSRRRHTRFDCDWSSDVCSSDLFKGDAAFGSWLFRITANAAYQKLRARKGRQHELPWEQLLPALDEEGRHFEPMDDWSPDRKSVV